MIGRNFDFSASERFAENQLVCFIRPDSGYRFVMIGWAGMCGALSGMNEKGLTVTINAAKSDIPTGSTVNLKNIRNSDSPYHYARILELQAYKAVFTEAGFAAILRDTYGVEG